MSQEQKTCLYCGKTIYRKPKHLHCWQNVKYCSSTCGHRWLYYNRRKQRRQQKGFRHNTKNIICSWCETSFKPIAISHKHCSNKCRYNHKRYKVTEKEWIKQRTSKCIICNTTYIKTHTHRKVCSKKCRQEYTRKHSAKSRTIKGPPIREEVNSKKYNLDVNIYLELTKKCSICPVNVYICIHHIQHKSKGGKNHIDNYLPLCFNCHRMIHFNETPTTITELYKKLEIQVNIRQDFNIPNKLETINKKTKTTKSE